MKISSLADAPEKIKNTLIQEINNYSFDKSTGKYKPEHTIKDNLREHTGYMLEMLWQARYDKMSVETRDAMDWLTKNLIDELLQSKYKGIKSHDLSFEGENHKELSYEVIEKTFQLFKATPGIELTTPVEGFSFKKLFKMK